MSHPLSGRSFRRADARRWRVYDQRLRAQRQHRGQRGQTVIIFALTVSVLLGMAGLAIDAMRLYDLYARAQRAAEAGALAGVMYLPCFYNSSGASAGCTGSSPDGMSAVERAMQEVYRNGFGTFPTTSTLAQPCPNPAALTEVAVCMVPGKTTDLQVTVTETTDIFLLSAVGVGPTTISASAQAEYLPPIQMGSRQTYFGDQAECTGALGTVACSPGDSTQTHVQNFLASMNGPAELKEQGDPFVYCEEGPSPAPPLDSGSYTVYNGYTTNHAQWPGGDPRTTGHCGLPSATVSGNPDQQPSGYAGPMTSSTAHPGAYNYAVAIPPGGTGSSVWVYMPNFIPANTGSNSQDQFLGGATTYGGLTFDNYYDDPSFYFNVTYTIYAAPVTYLRALDTPVSSTTFTPYDMMSGDLSRHGCATGGSQAYKLDDSNTTYNNPALIDASGSHCINFSTIESNEQCVNFWCPISPPAGLPAGTYRLAIEVTGIKSTVAGVSPTLFGWGSKSYGVKICGPSSTIPVGCATTAGSSLAAWNNMDVIFQASGNAYFDLGCIPAQYAGRTIEISIFDPGDSSGNVYVRLVPPAGSGITITYPAGIRTGLDATGQTAIFASNGGDRVLNGRWVRTIVNLPSTYGGSCGGAGSSGWWQVYYSTTGSPPHDKVGVGFSLVGSPVHLVPLG